ncbi:MAG: WecB/TagA/CpsF family glycosyltransferase [Bacteroidetes bacterium]|nr:WecB/TagA/CpsF family glycosyltransferase [Bacteroidota bacterium]
MKDTRFYIEGLGISKVNLQIALDLIGEEVKKEGAKYICVTNARAAYHAIKNGNYCKIQNESFLTLPDGKPLEIIAKFRGYKNVKRTCGPDIFNELCRISKEEKYTHFFYGSTQEILDNMIANLKIKYPFLDIVGAVSPPFGTADELVNDEIISEINHIKPTFIWLGLGAPKQEIVASKMVKQVNNSILIGIGFVFEYEAGKVKRPPMWIQKSGFEWLYRVFKQFKRSKNFVIPFLYFVYLLFIEFFKSLLRLK